MAEGPPPEEAFPPQGRPRGTPRIAEGGGIIGPPALEDYQAALLSLRNKTKTRGFKTLLDEEEGSLDPDTLRELAVVAKHIYDEMKTSGTAAFDEWADEMVRRLGNESWRPYMNRVWDDMPKEEEARFGDGVFPVEASPELEQASGMTVPAQPPPLDTLGAAVATRQLPGLRNIRPGAGGEKPSRTPSYDAIRRELAQAWAIPVRKGKMGRERGKKLGEFKFPSTVIRLRDWNMVVLAHEIGHHAALMKDLETKAQTAYDNELAPLGLYTASEDDGESYIREEGMANFFLLYSLDPDEAQRLAPGFTDFWNAELRKDQMTGGGVFNRAVNLTRQRFKEMQAWDPLQRLWATIAWLPRRQSIRETAEDVLHDEEKRWWDRNAPLRLVSQEGLEGKSARRGEVSIFKDPYELNKLLGGVKEVAEEWIWRGVRLHGKKIAPSLKETLEPIVAGARNANTPPPWEHFQAYMKASRVAESLAPRMEQLQGTVRGGEPAKPMPTVTAPGLIQGIDPEDAAKSMQYYEQAFPRFAEAKGKIKQWTDAMLKQMVAVGAISQEEADAMAQWLSYFPFRKVAEDGAGAGVVGSVRGKPFKRIGAGAGDTWPAIPALIDYAYAIARRRAQQPVINAVYDMRSVEGMGDMIEVLPGPVQLNHFALDSIKKQLQELGVDTDDVDPETLLYTFTSGWSYNDRNEPITRVWTPDGAKFIRFKDDALLSTIMNPEPVARTDLGILGKLLRWPASVQRRAWVVYSPNFQAFNIPANLATAHFRSEHVPAGRIDMTLYDFLSGLFDYALNTENVRRAMSAGAGGAELGARGRLPAEKEARKLTESQARRTFFTIINPLDWATWASQALEIAPKLGEFRRASRAAMKVGMSEPEAELYAAAHARPVNVDFFQGGDTARAWSKYHAFFNANIQVQKTALDALKANPAKVLSGLASLGAIAALNWYRWKDDKDYDEWQPWEKSSYFPLYKIPGTHDIVRVVKIPPFSFIMNLTEHALDLAHERDPEWAKREFENLGGKLLGHAIPTAMLPIFEVAQNRSLWSGKTITNAFDRDKLPSQQRTKWTSETAKRMSDAFADHGIEFSPAKADYLLFGYLGSIGRDITNITDQFAGEKARPSRRYYEKTPFIRRLVGSNPYRSAASVTEVFERASRHRSIMKKEKMTQRDREMLKDYAPSVAMMKPMRALLQDINKIWDMQDIDPKSKREVLDDLYEALVALSRAALGKDIEGMETTTARSYLRKGQEE